MKAIFEKYKIQRLWHFTDESNLASIEKHGGLLSLAELTTRAITITAPGGNPVSHSQDRKNGTDRYVHLSFVNQSPMLYIAQEEEKRVLNARWLSINPAVALVDGVMYCEGYANANDASLINAEQAVQKIDFDVLFTYMDWKQPEVRERLHRARKAEILIPRHIPWESIEVIPT